MYYYGYACSTNCVRSIGSKQSRPQIDFFMQIFSGAKQVKRIERSSIN